MHAHFVCVCVCECMSVYFVFYNASHSGQCPVIPNLTPYRPHGVKFGCCFEPHGVIYGCSLSGMFEGRRKYVLLSNNGEILPTPGFKATLM